MDVWRLISNRKATGGMLILWAYRVASLLNYSHMNQLDWKSKNQQDTYKLNEG